MADCVAYGRQAQGCRDRARQFGPRFSIKGVLAVAVDARSARSLDERSTCAAFSRCSWTLKTFLGTKDRVLEDFGFVVWGCRRDGPDTGFDLSVTVGTNQDALMDLVDQGLDMLRISSLSQSE